MVSLRVRGLPDNLPQDYITLRCFTFIPVKLLQLVLQVEEI